MATLTLDRSIDHIRRRIRFLLAVRWAVLFALAGVAASLAGLLAVRIAGVPISVALDAAFLGVCALVGAAFGYLRRVTPLQAAVTTDARLGLRERLSSALDLRHALEADAMVQALVEDATRHAGSIDVREAYPLRLPRETRLLAVGLVALALAVLLPGLPIFQSPQRRAERAAMREGGERIVRIARELKKNPATRDSELARRIAQNMEQLGKELRAARVGKKQALVKLHALTKEVAEAQKRLARQGQSKTMARAASELRKAAGDASAAAQPAGSGRRLQAMADALSRNDRERMAEMLEKMAEQVASGKMSARELQQVAGELEKLAKALSGTDLQAAEQQLLEAAKRMRKGQLTSAARHLQKAGGT